MDINQLSEKLVDYCRKGDWAGAQNELYADNCVSIEPKGAPVERVEGLDAIIAKGQQFNEMVQEFHSIEVSDPIIAENHFSCSMKLTTTWKGAPGPSTMEEICVYTVNDGKVVQEEFFYTAPSQQ